MAINPVSLWNVEHGWTGVNPGFYPRFLEPEGGSARAVDYVKARWNKDDVTDYLQAFHTNFMAPTMSSSRGDWDDD